jgi:methionyl-tRNA formyltransferase
MSSNLKFAFFGTDNFSVGVLNELEKAGILPQLMIMAPDRPSGRGHEVHSPIAKKWAETRNIRVLQPEKLDEQFVAELKKENWDLFAVASYGKIISQAVLDIPKKGTLNVHPSLLPLYRGASPIESAMLDDVKETGVTILLVDEKMDHGPILNQEFVFFEEWPKKMEVEDKLAQVGGELLAKTIPLWIDGTLDEQEQDHDTATFTKKITKEMGEIRSIPIDPSCVRGEKAL